MEVKQIRKKSPKNGRTQTRVTFLCDNENYEILKEMPNKGRTINNALLEYFKKPFQSRGGDEDRAPRRE